MGREQRDEAKKDNIAEVFALLAAWFATEAGNHVRRRREEFLGGGVAPIRSKSSDVDPVTAVDLSSEELIRRLIAENVPARFSHVVGEEGGADSEESEVLWVVDPIDGTVNFLYDYPAYAVSIGVMVNGVTIAGAVCDVSRDILYFGIRGGGSYTCKRPAESIDSEALRKAFSQLVKTP